MFNVNPSCGVLSYATIFSYLRKHATYHIQKKLFVLTAGVGDMLEDHVSLLLSSSLGSSLGDDYLLNASTSQTTNMATQAVLP